MIALPDLYGIVFDGAMGTELQRRGLPPGVCSDDWTVERPDKVYEVHRSYLEAGSRVLTTNTFSIGRHAAKAVQIAREALRDTGVDGYIAGSIGPGLTAQYSPECPEEALIERRIAELAEAGVDWIQLETFYSVEDAIRAVAIAHQVGIAIGASFTFDPDWSFSRSLRGYEVARQLEDSGAAFVGANCTPLGERLLHIIRDMLGSCTLPVVVQPNAGMPRIVERQPVYDLETADFTRQMAPFVQMDRVAVGGCCGVGPDYIERLAVMFGR